MGSIVESRFNNNGTPNGSMGVDIAREGVQENKPDNKGKWLIITAISTALLLIVVVVLLVMILGREEKVCTYEDVMEVIEKDPSPSENWKIYVDSDLDEPEKALLIFSRVADGRQAEEDYEFFFELGADYIDLFGGELPSEFDVLSARAFTLEENRFRRVLFEVNDGCMRFDFEPDFSVLEKYSFTAGNCDEFGW